MREPKYTNGVVVNSPDKNMVYIDFEWLRHKIHDTCPEERVLVSRVAMQKGVAIMLRDFLTQVIGKME